jgi:hypothetical protein
MPEPKLITKEDLEFFLKKLREVQDETGIIITTFSFKTPVLVGGYIHTIEITVEERS